MWERYKAHPESDPTTDHGMAVKHCCFHQRRVRLKQARYRVAGLKETLASVSQNIRGKKARAQLARLNDIGYTQRLNGIAFERQSSAELISRLVERAYCEFHEPHSCPSGSIDTALHFLLLSIPRRHHSTCTLSVSEFLVRRFRGHGKPHRQHWSEQPEQAAGRQPWLLPGARRFQL